MRSWWDWQDAVIKHIRFWPDRAAIAAELEAHYEDHVKDLERIGYDQNLARERALLSMGDADEVGRALDRAHKPWLGWFWLVSKWSVIVCWSMLLLTVFSDSGWQYYFREPARRVVDYESDGPVYFSEGWEHDNAVRIMMGKGTNTVERCGDVFSVPYAAVWKCHYPATADNHYTAYDVYYLTVIIAADDRNPFDERGNAFTQELVYTVDDGTWYDTHYGYMETDENGKDIWGPADGRITCYPIESDLFRTLYQIRCLGLESLPEEWSTVSYEYGGEPWEIRIRWEEVAS